MVTDNQQRKPSSGLDNSLNDSNGTVAKRHRVRWAPLNIGIERRLQTFIVLCHTLTIAIFLTAFFFVCAMPLFWPLLLPYLIYISLFSTAATSGSLKSRWQSLRSLPIWKLYAAYFPARLHRTEVLPPTRKYIFGYHPHGIISHGAFAAFGTEALGFSQLFPGITNTLLTLDSNFRVPFYREYAMALGLASVSRESCENLLTKGGADGEGMGRAITIVIGGARESLDAQPGRLRLVLKSRKGFVRLAVRTGADLVPVLGFGENDLYEQVNSEQHPLIHRFQILVKKTMGFTIPLFHARGVFNYDVGLMPYRRPLNIVVGRPIQVLKQQDNRDVEESYINDLHDRYVQELNRVWEEWRDVYAVGRTSELEITA
ncbi:diacylglycerol acyltransferase type 2A [Talaromyces proteolyticus]|uniref:Diacylglycerol O-acyltransferase n=1 Tax=Talaromyces proteolyticus TaxID=1131652 RepID=A0AAD4KQG0_9EURO|nr:diacylglycerol acyltransferase type 2A [Talaromyces proteolyticus]KAH8698254.1 diacylglycerol acyltransferase type 2A [Talaromyces proteolyticus]